MIYFKLSYKLRCLPIPNLWYFLFNIVLTLSDLGVSFHCVFMDLLVTPIWINSPFSFSLITISGRNFSPIPTSTEPLCDQHLLTRQGINFRNYLHKFESGDCRYKCVQIKPGYERTEIIIWTKQRWLYTVLKNMPTKDSRKNSHRCRLQMMIKR